MTTLCIVVFQTMVIRNSIKRKDTIQSIINLITTVVREDKILCILLLLHKLRIEIEVIIQTRNLKDLTLHRLQKISVRVELRKIIHRT